MAIKDWRRVDDDFSVINWEKEFIMDVQQLSILNRSNIKDAINEGEIQYRKYLADKNLKYLVVTEDANTGRMIYRKFADKPNAIKFTKSYMERH